MSHCRPAGEIDLITYGWMPPELIEIYKDATLEDFILDMRNGGVNSYIYDDQYTEKEKLVLMDAVEEARNVLIANGFFRSSISTGVEPELRFVLWYMADLGLMKEMEEDSIETFLPYFASNEDYEKYNFCLEKVDALIGVLADYLLDDELAEVALDIRGSERVDTRLTESAKEKIVKHKDELIPELETVFMMF